MSNRLELAGQTFGRWTVLYQEGKTPGGNLMWFCFCECGEQGFVAGSLLVNGTSTSCGRWCSTTPTHRHVSSDGYVFVTTRGHPKARRKDGQVREHVLVMESMLGRYLLPGENVHHKNGVRDDNRPENLELWVSMQPSGQRPEDLVVWAKEILERYDSL